MNAIIEQHPFVGIIVICLLVSAALGFGVGWILSEFYFLKAKTSTNE